MPRGRKKSLKFRINKKTTKSIIGIVFIFVSFLSYVALALPDYKVNHIVFLIYRRLFGLVAYLIPFNFLLLGFTILGFRWKVLQYRVQVGFWLLSFSLCSIFHVFYSYEKGFAAAIKGFGGGLVGYKLSQVLSNLISYYGAFFVFLFGVFLSLFFITNLSTEQVIQFFDDLAQKFKNVKLPKPSFKFVLPKIKKEKQDSLDQNSESFVIQEVQDSQFSGEFNNVDQEEKGSFEILSPPSEPLSEVVEASQEGETKESGELVSLVADSQSQRRNLPYANKVWEYPPHDLLSQAPPVSYDINEVKKRQKIIEETLKSFGIKVEQAGYSVGPTVTQYAYSVPAGTRIAKISNLQVDLAMALESPTGSVRLEIPIPGRNAIGVEVPNAVKSLVYFREVLESEQMKSMKSKIAVGLGKDVSGAVRTYDIAKMPHLLVAGATGSGKSVFLHSIMFSILYRASPQEVKFILIDPKRVELLNYEGIPHLITPVITDMEKAPSAFRWAVNEMTRRYQLFEKARARNIEAYNEKSGFQALPYIIIMVDELADIMVVDPASVERSIVRLSQLSRATGIHMVLTVQRPSTDILTGLIKANIPCRVAFNVTSQVDSRVIIDQAGAEKLVGRGDMLFVPPDASKPIRIQGCWISDAEISKLVDWLKNTGFIPDYKEEVLQTPDEDKKPAALGSQELDEKYEEAKELVIATGKASTSFLQRKLSLGYARAAKIIDQLEQNGIISPHEPGKERRVLVSNKDLNFVDNFKE